MNLYGFAAGDPASYSDPYGLCPTCGDDAVEYWADVANNSSGAKRVGATAAGLFAALWTTETWKETALTLGPDAVLAAGGRAIAGYRAYRAGRAGNAARSSANGLRLWKQLASDELLIEARAGRGTVMAGAGARNGRQIDDIGRLTSEYGGAAGDWAKMTTRARTAPDGTAVAIHWYENVKSGARVEFKQKF